MSTLRIFPQSTVYIQKLETKNLTGHIPKNSNQSENSETPENIDNSLEILEETLKNSQSIHAKQQLTQKFQANTNRLMGMIGAKKAAKVLASKTKTPEDVSFDIQIFGDLDIEI